MTDSVNETCRTATIPLELLEAYVELQRAAEYQVENHGDDTVQMVTDSLKSIRLASK